MKTDRIKLIALDLDGTTLNEEKHLSPANRNAIVSALAAGIHVVIASGRSFATLPREVLDIPGIDYAITANGAAVCRVKDGTRCYENLLDPDTVEQILRWVPPELALEAFIRGDAYADALFTEDPGSYGMTPVGAAYIRATRAPVTDIRSFIREHSGELDALDVVTQGEGQLTELWRLLDANVPGVYITSSVPQLLELSRRGGGKRTALSWLAGELGCTAAEVAAFGDAENDREMILWAGLGVAMGNARETVKQAADVVTRDYREDGVAYIIEKICGEDSYGRREEERR